MSGPSAGDSRAGLPPEGVGRIVVPAVSEGVIYVMHDGTIGYANPAALRLLGYADAELVGKPEHELLHRTRADGSPFPVDRCPIHGTLRDRAVHHSYGETFWRKDGSSFPVEYTATPMTDPSGNPTVVVVFTDNSERARSAEIERKAQEHVQRIYESIPEAYVEFDSEWRIVYANPVAARLPKPEGNEPVLGRVIWEIFPELKGTPVEENYRRAMREKIHVRFEAYWPKTQQWFDIAASPTADDRLGVYLRDITERKHAEDEARAASIARPLARKIIQDLVEAGGVAHQILTQVGRNLAGETSSRSMDEFVQAFAEMGLGKVQLERAEGQRYSFGGSDLLEKRPGSRTTTCSFTLGYLSEAVSRIHSNEPTLGTEIECQSRGAKECKFVVQVKKPEEGLARRVKELV